MLKAEVIFISGNQFQLNTKNTSYVMHNENGILTHTYYGKSLPVADHGYMAKRCRYNGDFQSNVSENLPSLDNALLEYAAFGDGGITAPALEVLNSDGTNFAELKVTGYNIIDGKPEIEGLPASYAEAGDNIQTLEIITADKVSGIEVRLYYAVFYDYDIITRFAKITNSGKAPVTLLRTLSGNIALDNKDYDVITNYGTWARERQIERTPLAHSAVSVSSNCGSSSHGANPFLILCDHTATEDFGEAVGIALVYSGNHKMTADLNRYGIINLSGGISNDNFSWNLKEGESFSTPELVMSFSDKGLGSLSQNFHTLIRNRVCRGTFRNARRPVLLNLWEACSFDFTEETVKRAADACSELGIEMLVIDDGWFGKRNTDTCALGDWFVNEEKLKGGLKPLCDYVNSKGLKLGIWFEPEMICPVSELYEKHPEWTMKIEGRKPTTTRWQLMLDLTNPEVCDYIYDSIANILKSANIEYVKWDYNRTMAHIGSAYLKAEQMGEYCHRYMLGLYTVLERLVTDFPNVLFEGCASGGGRFDMGMLYYTPQIWTSDDTDAVERVSIQYGTSFIYPMSTQSAHVSVCPNYQTGRSVSMKARHVFALTGSFGYELAPEELSDDDKAYIKDFIKYYIENAVTFQNGKYFRLTNPNTDGYAAFEYLSDNKVIVGAMRVKTHAVNLQTTIRLKGLEYNRVYTDENTGKEYLGAQLMQYGLRIESAGYTDDYQTFLWSLK